MSTETHQNRYAGRGQAYDSRPQYPTDFVHDVLRKENLKPGDVVADFGSGIGNLTGKLLDYGLDVYAVEPSDMRKKAEATHGSRSNFHSIEGEAKTPNLPESLKGKFKAIIAGQALHWWGAEYKEVVPVWNRLLEPAGNVIALTYHFNDNDPFSQELDAELHESLGDEYDRRIVKLLYRNSPGFSDEGYSRYLAPDDRNCEKVGLEFAVDQANFTGLFTSFSFMPNPQTRKEDSQRVFARLMPVFHKHAKGEGAEKKAVIPYTLKAWHGQLINPALVSG